MSRRWEVFLADKDHSHRKIFWAHSPHEAAALWGQWFDESRLGTPIAGNQAALVNVQAVDTTKVIQIIVSGEIRQTYEGKLYIPYMGSTPL